MEEGRRPGEVSDERLNNPCYVWSYERIDWDLLRDDLDAALGISPTVAWHTRDAAIRAVEFTLQEEWEDYVIEATDPEEAAGDFPYERPEWEKGSGNEEGDVLVASHGDETIRVFSIRIDEE